LAIEVSSTSINAASATVIAISHGFTLGFHCTCTARSGFSIFAGGVPAPDPPRPPATAGPAGRAGNVLSIADNSGLLKLFLRSFCA
jgi:hypothetical protein